MTEQKFSLAELAPKFQQQALDAHQKMEARRLRTDNMLSKLMGSMTETKTSTVWVTELLTQIKLVSDIGNKEFFISKNPTILLMLYEQLQYAIDLQQKQLVSQTENKEQVSENEYQITELQPKEEKVDTKDDDYGMCQLRQIDLTTIRNTLTNRVNDGLVTTQNCTVGIRE